jgi:hypothetical protein
MESQEIQQMKSRLTVLLATLCLAAVVVVPASAETIQLTGTVPFSFVAGNRTMPAGDYTLNTTPAMAGAWVISGAGDRAGSFVVAQPGAKKASGETPRLVFTRYGDRYFLSQIWTKNSDHVLRVPVSRTERAMAREVAVAGTAIVAAR